MRLAVTSKRKNGKIEIFPMAILRPPQNAQQSGGDKFAIAIFKVAHTHTTNWSIKPELNVA